MKNTGFSIIIQKKLERLREKKILYVNFQRYNSIYTLLFHLDNSPKNMAKCYIVDSVTNSKFECKSQIQCLVTNMKSRSESLAAIQKLKFQSLY